MDLFYSILCKQSMVSRSVQVVSQPVAGAVAEGDSLISQAIINSGIALETEAAEAPEQAGARSPKGNLQNPEAESRVSEIQVTEECVEVEAETVVSGRHNEDSGTVLLNWKNLHCSKSGKSETINLL